MTSFATARETAGGQQARRPAVRWLTGPCPAEGGFSLPELLVVLVIVGILSALLLPHVEILKYRMDGSARGFMTALVMAQRTAVKRQHDVVVTFDVATRRIRVHEDADNDGERDPGERVRHLSLDEDVIFGLGSAPARTVDYSDAVNFADEQDGMPAVRFHRSGSTSTQGSFYLTSTRSLREPRFAKDTRSVELDRATGRASWYYFDPPAWEPGF